MNFVSSSVRTFGLHIAKQGYSSGPAERNA
uniref:Uncharacterized protein n=1 Tax=Arundo donax TaxID=35708 RepID=A0A0A9GY74_ARUDO